MVSALIMPRPATMQASWIPKRSRSRLTTGNNNVTSAVLPGIRKEAIGRSASSEHDAEDDLLQMPLAVVFGTAALRPGSHRRHPRTTSSWCRKMRNETALWNSGWRWRQSASSTVSAVLRPARCRPRRVPGHRLIGVVEIEPFSTRHAHPAAPVIGMAVGARDHQPVQHGEVDRALDIKGKAPVGNEALEHIAATPFPPIAGQTLDRVQC